MTFLRLVIAGISMFVSSVLTNPVAIAVTKKYFGYPPQNCTPQTNGCVSPVLFTIIGIVSFAAISICVYLFLQDVHSIVWPKSSKKETPLHT